MSQQEASKELAIRFNRAILEQYPSQQCDALEIAVAAMIIISAYVCGLPPTQRADLTSEIKDKLDALIAAAIADLPNGAN